MLFFNENKEDKRIISLTKEEIELINTSLNNYGIANFARYTSGKKYWNLKNKLNKIYSNEENDKFIEIPKSGIGDLSDGYHTFNELYHHRAVLFSIICNSYKELAWKSKLHDTGDMYEGMFIVGIQTPEGQATYHYDINPYWDLFNVKELEKASKWDGHTPEEAIKRLESLKSIKY